MREKPGNRVLAVCAVVLFGGFVTLKAQENLNVVDTPTAGLLERGQVAFNVRLFPSGGVLGSVDVGLARSFLIGLSYGGVNVIGYGGVQEYNGTRGRVYTCVSD